MFLIFISNCTLKDVEKHHGFSQLDKKREALQINISNKNDILENLGPPSTKGSFNNDIWIYIEKKEMKQSLLKFGATKIVVNNILILEMDNRGLLIEQQLLTIEDMNKLSFSKDKTSVNYKRETFIYNFLSSVRQKVNDPLGKRSTRSKKK